MQVIKRISAGDIPSNIACQHLLSTFTFLRGINRGEYSGSTSQLAKFGNPKFCWIELLILLATQLYSSGAWRCGILSAVGLFSNPHLRCVWCSILTKNTHNTARKGPTRDDSKNWVTEFLPLRIHTCDVPEGSVSICIRFRCLERGKDSLGFLICGSTLSEYKSTETKSTFASIFPLGHSPEPPLRVLYYDLGASA